MQLSKIQIVKIRGKEEFNAWGLSPDGDVNVLKSGRGPTIEAAIGNLLIRHGAHLEIEVEDLGVEPELTPEEKKERVEAQLRHWSEYYREQVGREITEVELAEKRALLEKEIL